MLPPVSNSGLVVCTADEVEGIVLPTCINPQRTFHYLSNSLPTAMLQHNSWVQIVYHHNGTQSVTQAFLVRSTKGFVDNNSLEIVELESVFANPTHPEKTILLLLPSPFIHQNVPISVERDSFNRETIDAVNTIWTEKEEFADGTELLLEEQEERDIMVMKLLQRQTIAYRLQRPI